MRLRCLILLATTALLQACGATMLRTSCENPRVSNFGAPSSYVVMLPYSYAGESEVSREATQQLNRIIRLQALRGAAAMPETQVTLIEGDPATPACDIENIYDRVVENRSGLFWRKPFHSAVFVWGEVFDEGDGLAVQSHLRVFWNGVAARELEVSADAPALIRPLRFSGELPEDTISFPVQTLTRSAQQQLAGAIGKELQLRKAPSLDAEVAELPSRFSAVSWKRPWLELQGRDLRSVWLLIDDQGIDVGSILPETLFVRAITSYLNFRVNRDAESRQQAMRFLAQFRAAVPRSGQAMPRVPLALSEAIEGTLSLPTRWYAQPGAEQVPAQTMVPAQAQTTLVDAARQLPANGELLNLAAIARIPACCKGGDAAANIREIQRMLEQARSLERGNLKIGQNLLRWYTYLQTLPAELLPFSAAELQTHTERARDSLAALSSLRAP